jgi:hypothetical protein
MKIKSLVLVFCTLFSSYAFSWEAKVTNILQHGEYAAISLSPDPGVGNCEFGQPYILIVDDTAAAKQRFSMLLTALSTGNKVGGYADACSSAIWGQSRPTIRRLRLTTNK